MMKNLCKLPFVRLLPALVLLTLAGGTAHAQIYQHPDPASGRTSYPVERAHRLDRFAENAIWSGEARQSVEDGVPGLLQLAETTSGGNVIINLNAFATARSGEKIVQILTSPSPALVIQVPGSAKCPAEYSPAIFSQLGTNMRTHWTLIGLQPGTTFTLTLSVQCRSNAGGQLTTHQDRWTWKVVATPDSLRSLLVALHGHNIGTAGIPVLINETAYNALIAAVEKIQARIRAHDNAGAKAAIDAMDALVVSYAAGPTGVYSSPENPADCWIRVELEYLRSLLP